MSPKLRLALVFLAAAVTAFLASGVLLPPTVSAILAAVVAGLAGIGILPPTWLYSGSNNDRAIKRNAPTRKTDRKTTKGARIAAPPSHARSTSFQDHEDVKPRPPHRRQLGGR